VDEANLYRRLLLDLRPGGIDRVALRIATDLARLMDVEVLGVFVEDQSVIGAANLPFTRELRLLTKDWRPVTSQSLASELESAAEQARALLIRESAAAGIHCRFEVRRGDLATTVVSLCNFHDIIVVPEPGNAMDLLTGIAGRVRQAALSSDATVLLLPARPSRSVVGPVIAIVVGATDPALAIAAGLAASAQQGLVVMTAGDDPEMMDSVRSAAASAGLPRQRVELLSLSGQTVQSAVQALGGRRGRFLIMSRNKVAPPGSAADRFPEELRMPVLMIEPSPVAE
jgi:hypothetical protein